jgi:hypothetical protein
MIRRSLKAAGLTALLLTMTGAAAAAPGIDAERRAAATELLRQSDQVVEQIQQLRGVRATRSITREVESRATLRSTIAELAARELTAAQVESTDRLLTFLGVLTPGQDYLQLSLDLLEEQIAGFYDEESQTFRILDDMPAAMQPAIMAHELFHAIQDQVWDLDRVRSFGDIVTDVGTARTALIEGDALAVMLMYQSGGEVDLTRSAVISKALGASTKRPESGVAATVSEPLWQSLVAPYTVGMRFVTTVARERQWSGVDAVYLDPPRSSEQVLHPERYLDRDEPTWLTYRTGMPTDARYIVDVLGEFMGREVLANLLRGRVSHASVERGMAGWDGDRLEGWRLEDGRERVTWLLVWDSVDDAESFARVASMLAIDWVGADPDHRAGAWGGSAEAASDSAALRVERWGDLVAVVLEKGDGAAAAVRRDELAAVTGAMLCSAVRRSYPPESAGWDAEGSGVGVAVGPAR